jgi:transcriptional/translational regulatory protein YebC/TACO1
VAYLIEQCGMIVFDPVNDGEELFELALESGVEDITETDDGGYEIKTGVADFMRVKSALIAAEYVPSHAELTRLATTTAPVTTIKEAEQLQALVDRLEDLDDVQSVYHNAEFSEQVLEQIEGDT